MKMSHRISELIIKRQRMQISVEERIELDVWSAEHPDHIAIVQKWTDADRILEELVKNERAQHEMWQRILAASNGNLASGQRSKQVNGRRSIKRLLSWTAAACALAIAGSGLYLQYAAKPRGPMAPASTRSTVRHDIATLTLADGSRIDLETADNGVVVLQNGSNIVKQDGLLSYTPSERPGTANDATNTLTVPKKGFYRLELPDGTRVWLNSDSKITYPLSFTEKRLVKLTGEAYFEVTHQRDGNVAKPFIVEMGTTRIQVLGTQFNVMAYPDEEKIAATLLKGKIRVVTPFKSLTLAPGQQANILSDATVAINDQPDLLKVVAWKDGLFRFDESIPYILRQISRWYSVDVKYESQVDEVFHGTFDRSMSLDDILTALNSTGVINATFDGKTITVRSPDN